MSKRKTRSQKIIADLRKKVQHTPQSMLATDTPMQQISRPNNKHAYTYAAVSTPFSTKTFEMTSTIAIRHDLTRSSVVTAAILLAQIIIYILVTSHKIIVPGVTY